VMYAGKIVELAPADELYLKPLHPYTEGLLGSFPSLVGPRRELVGLVGFPPDLRHVPSGCAYHERCPIARDTCTDVVPKLDTYERHSVSCHFRSPRPRTIPAGNEGVAADHLEVPSE
jgi:peptide/nickel transport system ATP-binding protein